MFKGESVASFYVTSGFEWVVSDDTTNKTVTVHTEDEQFDINSFETGQNCTMIKKSSGFEFIKGHTYHLRCRHYLEYKGS
ncbi:MAG: hypothetical protein IJQ80_07310, partial [Clostridia bacterium]|nr:hypothetical protein [Clostridia bacterium]